MVGENGDAPAAVVNAIARIWDRHRDEVLARVDALDEAAAALLAGRLGDDLRVAAQRAAHKLAGTAGTFGFSGASRSARKVELELEAGVSSGRDKALLLMRHAAAIRAELSTPRYGETAQQKTR